MLITYFLQELIVASYKGNLVKTGRLGNAVRGNFCSLAAFLCLQSLSLVCVYVLANKQDLIKDKWKNQV